MASDSTTRWPLLDERPFATARQGSRGRRPPRSAWLLTGLAFLCGGLVSAAGFSIGWRHQAQRDTAAQSALAATTARARRLEHRVAALQASLESARSAAARAQAVSAARLAAAAKVGSEAAASSGDSASISSGAGALAVAAARIASELKTLDTYLTTTPAAELDPGYVSSQTGYLGRQLTGLREASAGLGGSVASFDTALHRLSRDARALKNH